MKSFFASLLIVACALHEAGAFSTPPPLRSSSLAAGRQTHLYSATISSNSNSSPRNDVKPARPLTAHEQREMETIRRELIEKYIKLGHSEEYADREVDYFLEDSDRSAQYVEMRRIAMARGNDLGIENFVQFAAAFLVGMLLSWALNSFH
mmetsp:Transcript_36702/g.62491  ORF Transcript_36702/g.62491 Transcript_36702/m.62491 type:complete len:150 (-) Transcript_36702:475-924(-)|eukprot:CAMPEP_0183721984 /NCGR_PEP_ID=MMETSP0737-20130205/14072_1 /TAXON_ID=385413 /ORGANISM="Thalassiosira miniscula, Strain CCMP1093" /LENGTH=149 /DNA_ID=CAMNT_0025952061 /DNA_START=140 /DNA_END=589 /DNA_ORIENTATION=+